VFARNYILVMRYNKGGEAGEASTDVRHAERSHVCCKKERVNHTTYGEYTSKYKCLRYVWTLIKKRERSEKAICKIIGGICGLRRMRFSISNIVQGTYSWGRTDCSHSSMWSGLGWCMPLCICDIPNISMSTSMRREVRTC